MTLSKKKYSFHKYSPNYKKEFKIQEKKLKKILGTEPIIEHVGSTAVPGLGGKGIIDIAILTPKNKLKSYVTKLSDLGYVKSSNHPADTRRIFMQKIIIKGKKEKRTHVHLCLTKNFWNSLISARDFLRKNKQAREEYTKLKKEAVKIAKGDGEKYRKHKADFLKRISDLK